MTMIMCIWFQTIKNNFFAFSIFPCFFHIISFFFGFVRVYHLTDGYRFVSDLNPSDPGYLLSLVNF